MIRKIVFELVVSFLIGMLPVLYAAIDGSTDQLKDFIGVLLMQNSLILYYMLALLGASLAVAGLNRFIWKRTEVSRNRWNFWTAALLEAGSSAIGILRATAGVLISISVLWVLTEPETLVLTTFSEMLGLGVVAVIECAIIKEWHSNSERMTRVPGGASQKITEIVPRG